MTIEQGNRNLVARADGDDRNPAALDLDRGRQQSDRMMEGKVRFRLGCRIVMACLKQVLDR